MLKEGHASEFYPLYELHDPTPPGKHYPIHYPRAEFSECEIEFIVIMATHSAVELMMRFRVPEGIDLRRVRTYLVQMSKPFVPGMERAFDQMVAAIAIDKLDRHLAPPPRTWLAALAAERIIIGSLLLVAFCICATTMAPCRVC